MKDNLKKCIFLCRAAFLNPGHDNINFKLLKIRFKKNYFTAMKKIQTEMEGTQT